MYDMSFIYIYIFIKALDYIELFKILDVNYITTFYLESQHSLMQDVLAGRWWMSELSENLEFINCHYRIRHDMNPCDQPIRASRQLLPVFHQKMVFTLLY